MSTGFSFIPARRRSREAQRALEPAADGADVGDGGCSAGWLRRHAGEGVYKHRKPSVPVGGRKLPVEGEGPSADGRGTGRIHDERGSGCVSAGIPQINPAVSARPETSEPRHRLNLRRPHHSLRCPRIAELAGERSGGG
jgi:hypothetical protein